MYKINFIIYITLVKYYNQYLFYYYSTKLSNIIIKTYIITNIYLNINLKKHITYYYYYVIN